MTQQYALKYMCNNYMHQPTQWCYYLRISLFTQSRDLSQWLSNVLASAVIHVCDISKSICLKPSLRNNPQAQTQTLFKKFPKNFLFTEFYYKLLLNLLGLLLCL